MKKLLLIALALNFVACSSDEDNTTTSNQIVEVKTDSFSPNPTPLDYRNAQYPSFMEDLKNISNKNISVTGRIAEVWVNTYVPDVAFRNKLIAIGAAQDPVPGDNYIEVDSARIGLFVSNSGITDLTGIQSFTGLSFLNVTGNNLTSLNISALTNLNALECQNNKITSLNLSANTNLTQIWCQDNLLTSLTLPSAVNTLWGVWCYNNKLTTLNLNGNTKITHLFIQSNQLTAFDFSPYTKLEMLNCSFNSWIILNFDSNINLTTLWCFSNPLLKDISIKSGFNEKITTQEFKNNAKYPPIHVDQSFLINANTSWPNRGGSTYVL
jgi:hypothetical protein